ncbi:hypothetical protein [Sulfitobacter sp. BSw21498]|uniref:hypothetical protein n=1 Tax=Sulfitobacter sp. BSw21498 TaxID=664426 RepID=UPI001110AE39|nr:hypothetical protein [Sulfitobacter sp. BSw21498]
MYWLLKKFGWLVALTGTLIGALFLPTDFMDWERAVQVWGEVLTVGNREVLLAVLCAICLLRLAYLDQRRALNDKDWPPIRSKLSYGLSVVFRRDRRIAELKKVIDDDGVKSAKDRYVAGHALNRVDWSNIADLDEFGDEVVITEAMDHISISARRRVVRQAIEEKENEIRERLCEIESALGFDASDPLRNSTHRLANANITPCKPRPAAKFPDQTICEEWCQMQGKVNRTNRVLDQLQVRLRQKMSEPFDITPSEEWSSQLLQDIE